MKSIRRTAILTTQDKRLLRATEIEALHLRCGIYTKPAMVTRILDSIGWRADVDLSSSVLLEPAAGDGAFLVEAARRLIMSCRRVGIAPTARILGGSIWGYELHPREARHARSRIVSSLIECGVPTRTVTACAKRWVRNSDFLCAKLPEKRFTHVVGNPPYVRWSKIPIGLRRKYESLLPADVAGGDLFLAFLDRALRALSAGGKSGFLCSDRWRFNASAEGFRSRWLPQLKILSEEGVTSKDAFVEDVDSYPQVFIARKRASPSASPKKSRTATRGRSLEELGCRIKVGPALGHTPAFVLASHEADVEPGLLSPWIDATEIAEGRLTWKGRRVIATYREDGNLVDVERFPMLAARLDRYRKVLTARSIVLNGAPWHRSIDRVRAADWSGPKILVPELSKVPRCAIDRSGAIPSHGVYAIFAPNDEVDALYEKLRDGRLAAALTGIAPQVKGGYVRCYRRFLAMIRIDD